MSFKGFGDGRMGWYHVPGSSNTGEDDAAKTSISNFFDDFKSLFERLSYSLHKSQRTRRRNRRHFNTNTCGKRGVLREKKEGK
jgi:hypothetical protein